MQYRQSLSKIHFYRQIAKRVSDKKLYVYILFGGTVSVSFSQSSFIAIHGTMTLPAWMQVLSFVWNNKTDRSSTCMDALMP